MPAPIDAHERARRAVVVALTELGENVLDRERAAAAIIAKLTGVGIMPGTRYEAVPCACLRPGRTAVHDRAENRHALVGSVPSAVRLAERLNAGTGGLALAMLVWHEAKP